MKTRYDAASAFTALVKMIDNNVMYNNFRDMHKSVITRIKSIKQMAKKKSRYETSHIETKLLNSDDNHNTDIDNDGNESKGSNDISSLSKNKKGFKGPRGTIHSHRFIGTPRSFFLDEFCVEWLFE
jgi:hypothetical protein